MKVVQEFMCHGCHLYIHFKLEMGWDRIVTYTCTCGRKHQRAIKAGLLTCEGRDNGMAVEELIVTPSACSTFPISAKMKEAAERDAYAASRDAIPVTDAELIASAFLSQSWIDRVLNPE